MIPFSKINKIAEEAGSPFYLFHKQKLIDNISRMQNAFVKRYPNFILGYSYKTNYLPAVCKVVKELGGYAEVVSAMEYELALRLGYEPQKIIFNGPVKKEKALEKALLGGSIVNLDSFQELKILENFCKKHPSFQANVGIRININLKDEKGNANAQGGIDYGRFGFSPKDIASVIAKINDLGAIIFALHGHSSGNRKVENYVRIVETLCTVREEHSLNFVRYFNVGGGFFGKVPKEIMKNDPPSFDEYAEAITEAMLNDKWVLENRPYLIVEPGISVSSDVLSFYTQIYSRKKINSLNIVTVDGSFYNIKPTGHAYNLPMDLISKDSEKNESKDLFKIVGSTCLEFDVLAEDLEIDNPQEEDFLGFHNVGAYTMVMAPPFINLAPAIVEMDNDKVNVIREEQSVEHFFGMYAVEENSL